MYTEAKENGILAKAEVKKRAEGITPPARLRRALCISLILSVPLPYTHTHSLSPPLAFFFSL